MRRWFTVLAASTAVFASACLNDRDSLAFETRRFPGLVEITAGRFERNPPKYYEMRIARIEKQGGPKTLDEFDDEAVAYGRIGKEDKAIAVMAAKAGLMKTMGERATKMDWYRYHANLGTFQVHRWFHDGGDTKRLDEVREAAKNIEKSIELNPDAHFGRERSQLQVMRWIIDIKTKQTKDTLGEWLKNEVRMDRADPKKEVTGLLGLVVLGAAWESVDVFDAIGKITARDLQEFTFLRVEELQRAGKKSFTGVQLESGGYIPAETKEYYADLKANAVEFQSFRTAFMEKQFAAGKHPDTDKDFWTDYHEVPPLPQRPVKKMGYAIGELVVQIILLGIGGLFIVAIGTSITRARARRLV